MHVCIILNGNNASNQHASKEKILDKMKQPLEILIKLKFMFMSYAKLFNGSITFPHNVMHCYAERYFFILLPYPHTSAQQIYEEFHSAMHIRITCAVKTIKKLPMMESFHSKVVGYKQVCHWSLFRMSRNF